MTRASIPPKEREQLVNAEHPDRESLTLLNRWFLDCLDVASTLGQDTIQVIFAFPAGSK